MNIKQFLRPDGRKTLVMIFLIILTWISYVIGVVGLVIAFAYILLIVGFPMLIVELMMPFKIISVIIYWYLLSCLIVWIYDKMNKTKKVYEMKKVHWALLTIFIIIFVYFIFAPRDYCNLEKDYKTQVNTAEEAANLINDYFSQTSYYQDTTITSENISITNNEFQYGFIKVDENGKLFECIPPV
jgi:glucan phosphoethanolaminetransferase (alkaline phosphatase superfamily)